MNSLDNKGLMDYTNNIEAELDKEERQYNICFEGLFYSKRLIVYFCSRRWATVRLTSR